MSSKSTLYHLSPTGFWKKFRQVVAVNPDISSGLPIPSLHRYPPPASRPEKYSTPATKASDPAQNPYWKRDVRRVYPQLSVVTQAALSNLLIQHSSHLSISPPALDLPKAISTTANVYSEYDLPPALPTPHKKWVPKLSPPAPHDQHSYFPMSLYR